MIAGVALHRGRVASAAEQARLWALLDEEERAACTRLRFACDRARFVTRRGRRRELLGAALGRAPTALRFERGPWGKPRVAGAALHFSASSAGDDWLIAIAAQPLGCDLVAIDAFADAPTIAASLAPDEQALLAALPEHIARRRCAEFWAAKEAVTKALGTGLATAPDSFSLLDRDPARPETRARWLDARLHVAVAVAATPLPDRCC